MKKIPTLFIRVFEGSNITDVLPDVTPGMEWVLDGKGVATIKWDGAACAVIGGELYKRYDAKHGRVPPDNAIECSPKDPITGHWPHWVPINDKTNSGKWYDRARENYISARSGMRDPLPDGTYEAVGPHFQGNPYHLERDTLIPHGDDVILVERTYFGIKEYLQNHNIEGIVFWKDGEPRCKIKRTDFGFPWKGYDTDDEKTDS